MAELRGGQRSEYVQAMFDRIAGRYDLINRLISGGQDLKWRRMLVELAALPEHGRLLDIAAGTGDIAFEALKQSPGAQVVGADFALNMLQVGRRRLTIRTTRGLVWGRCLAAALRGSQL